MKIKNMLDIPTRNINENFEYNYFAIYKFLFVLLIAVIHHNYFNPTLINTSWLFKFIYQNGHELIYCFFIMSGILFYKIDMPKIDEHKLDFPKFIKKRLIRFLPLVFITTMTIFILNYVYFNRFNKDFLDCSRDPIKLIIDIIFAGQAVFGMTCANNSPLWFIHILLFLYPIAFIIAKLGKKYHFIYFFLCGLGIAMLYANINVPFFNNYIGKGLFGFSLGFMLATLLDKTKKLSDKSQLIIRLTWLLPLIAFIILISVKDIYTIRGNTLLFTFLLFLPLIGLFYNIKPINKFCSHKTFVVLEKISLGVYVWNYPIMLMFYLGFNNVLPPFASSPWFTLILLIVNLAFGLFTIYLNKVLMFFAQFILKKIKPNPAI